ncbi:MAG: hypothetical protein AAGC64_03890 [Bacteroidota bacterium]
MRLVCGFLVFVASISSCNETREAQPETLGYDFYPLEIGQYSIYEVEEIKYKITGFDTSIYQLRETIFDSIRSVDRTTYLIRREIRSDELVEWTSDALWSVAATQSYVAVSENSVPYIKLIFPVISGREWNGNSLNVSSERMYYYETVSTSVVDSIHASDHIKVVIEDIQENITGVDLRSEIYAKGIGLIEKDYLTQEKCTASNCGDDLGKVIAGRSLKQSLIEKGRETEVNE